MLGATMAEVESFIDVALGENMYYIYICKYIYVCVCVCVCVSGSGLNRYIHIYVCFFTYIFLAMTYCLGVNPRPRVPARPGMAPLAANIFNIYIHTYIPIYIDR